MDQDHSPQEVASRLAEKPRHSYLRDWVYGGMDGTVTTFAVVSGVIGASLESHVILILGFVNLVADGFSMAAANYLGTRAEDEQFKKLEAFERSQIDIIPEGEREEIRQIYRNKGFQGDLLDKVVDQITSDRDLWVTTMMQEEYGMSIAIRSPVKAALMTFMAFIICGFLPLLTFIFKINSPFLMASLLTGTVFFLIGSLKSRWSLRSWWLSGIRTLMIGSVAAVLAYLVGYAFKVYG